MALEAQSMRVLWECWPLSSSGPHHGGGSPRPFTEEETEVQGVSDLLFQLLSGRSATAVQQPAPAGRARQRRGPGQRTVPWTPQGSLAVFTCHLQVRFEVHRVPCSGTTGGLGSLSLLFTELSFLTYETRNGPFLAVSQDFMCIGLVFWALDILPDTSPLRERVCSPARAPPNRLLTLCHSERFGLGTSLQEGAQKPRCAPPSD